MATTEPNGNLEPFEVEGLGQDYLAPANERQEYDLVVFDKKSALLNEIAAIAGASRPGSDAAN